VALLRRFGRTRAVGLDIGSNVVRALVLEGRSEKSRITGAAAVEFNGAAAKRSVTEAIHAALAEVHADSDPVIAAIGGPDVVVRQITLPAIPANRIMQALALQHRDFGLLAPADGLLDAQILKRSKTECAVLAVSAPRPLVEARRRMLEQAAVRVQTLDVEALAVLNAVLLLGRVDADELLVVLNVGDEQSLLCLRSERGPAVVRYLDVGASTFVDGLRAAGLSTPSVRVAEQKIQDGDAARAAEACRDVVRRITDEIRTSLAFYRSEYDRESLPRYVLSGWLRLPQLNRWLMDKLHLEAPFAVADPFQVVSVTAPPAQELDSAGPEFVQAFGLALRGQ
jgi:type IV pilus assembly protein PilM